MTRADASSLPALLVGDGRSLVTLSGLILIGAGLFAAFQAATGHFLPHDEAYLGMTANELCQLQQCRIVHFMIHDRIAFGGALVAIGTLYLYLAAGPLAEGRAWAWWGLLLSGAVGFGSFLSYLGYGYLDTWHGAATIVMLPLFIGGMLKTRPLVDSSSPLAALREPGNRWMWRSRAGVGRALLLFCCGGLALAGAVIATVGMTSVFVPEDLDYMNVSPQFLDSINPRLIPLIAHDRAGFGGAVLCYGLTMLFCVWCARPSRALWQALLVTGLASFGTAIGVHFPIGYTTFTHLAPAYLGAGLFATGLALTAPAMSGPAGSVRHRQAQPEPAGVRQ